MPVGAGLRVASPPPGYGVAVTALTLDGRGLDLVVETDARGVTHVVETVEHDERAGARVRPAAGPAACADGRHSEIGFHWTKPWAWRFNARTTPKRVGRTIAEAQLRSAVRSITSARNDCGRPDRVGARARYLGRTSKKTAVRSNAGCGRWDSVNVVAFGNLPMSIAGVTCTIYTNPAHGRGQAIESDVLLNKRVYAWAARPGACQPGEVILRSVATHEFGHVFGLGHVSESSHPNLTMSESIGQCDDSAFTLGKGDIIGLERLY
jgi:acetyltransferase-like isoleucine patch superfamily enzyme